MKYKKTIIFFSVLIAIASIWYFEKYQKEKELSLEWKELTEFQKQWNKDLPKLKEKIKKGEFDNIEVKESKWKRYKIPYDKLLPPMPDEEENNSTLYGIDSNNNGVRDDLEILTVKEFWDDRDVVEVVFAGLRERDFGIYIYENNLINYDNIEEIIRRGNIGTSCFSHMTNNFNNIIYNKYFNSPERKKVEKEIMKSLGGHIDRGINITKKFCQIGVEKSKSWMYRNK